MKIYYDDIVYSLQKAGGISVVWENITKDVPYQCVHIRYKGTDDNQFAKIIDGHCYDIRSSLFLFIKRYFNPRMKREKKPFIFHSSYYRYCVNSNAINITTVHDFTYELYDKRLIGKIHQWQKRRAVMHSDGVICISENTKADLQKFYPEYKGAIVVIDNGYDTNTYYYENTEKDKIVLSVGARGGYKRFDLTVDIVKNLPDVKLVIVGGGQLTDAEISLLESKIPGRFEKKGYLSNDDLRILYNKAFFLSYPSDYEGFGIPVLEAQACGCPVVCQSKSSLPEVLQESALFIDPLNMKKAMLDVKKLYDREYYKSIIDLGLKNAKRFSWKKCRDETLAFYETVYEKQRCKKGKIFDN